MIAIYPGSFDPFHDGHLEIVIKASNLFDTIYIVVTNNINKTRTYTLEQSKIDIENKIQGMPKIKVITNEKELTVNFAKKLGAEYIVKGLRNKEDFELELEYYDGSKSIDKSIESVYFFSEIDKRKISSSVIKEIQRYIKK